MKNVSILKTLTVLTALTALGITGSPAQANTNGFLSKDDVATFSSYGLNPHALEMAFSAYKWAMAKGQVRNPHVLTVVDMTKANKDNRLYVLDLENKVVLMAMPVANGKNSGTFYATHFSNIPGSLQSSLGTYVTDETYGGKHGFSLRVKGLEKGINDKAYERAIVVHAAPYVSPEFIREHGRAGGSWGCFAVDPARSGKLINLIKGGSVIFSYADQNDPYITNMV